MRGARWILQMLAAGLLAAGGAAGQSSAATLVGLVTDEGGAPVSGAQVLVFHQLNGTEAGAVSGPDGRYTVSGLPPGGPYAVEAQVLGYALEAEGGLAAEGIVLEAGAVASVDFGLRREAIALDAIEVFATVADESRTPVAFSNIEKAQIRTQLGSRDLPLVLNVTPSTYSTLQGGGAGDARINVRGFNQNNLAVMINGVPVNDMENGWVYWSNWDGLGDASTSIQLQRGMSAVNLATPSIGGTLNVITDPSSMRPGFSFKQEAGLGSVDPDGGWGFGRNLLKETLTVHTGRFGNGFAITGSVVRKTGDGMYRGFFGGDATWTDAWAYYLATAYDVSERHRLEFYFVGAPQRHGQNLYKLNLGTLSHDFARSLADYDPAALARYAEAGRNASPNVGPVSPAYGGRQYASTGPGSGKRDRFSAGFLNERENYFHKPQANLNWHAYLGEGLSLSTVAYFAGGRGGGTGGFGSSQNAVFRTDFGQRVQDWDATIAMNRARGDGSAGYILRNSVNNQWTVGGISKLRKAIGAGWITEVGLDWRTAQVEHYREVRDLLGGEYYLDIASDFWTEAEQRRGLGDRINFNNTNTIDWLGAYVQGERTTARGSLWAMAGWARNSYAFTDHFARARAGTGRELVLESGPLHGYQVKGGAQRNVTAEWSVFGNVGHVSKVPIFDGVIDDNRGVVNRDPKNEKFVSVEVGTRLRSLDRTLSVDLNLYHTTWRDRTRNLFVRNLDGEGNDGLVSLLGVSARHMGVEVEAAYQPVPLLRFDGAASIGNWKYLDDTVGRYASDDRSVVEEFAFYIRNLKVADAPQTQFAYALSVFPVPGLMLQGVGRTYRDHYAEFSPFDRTDAGDRAQPWEVPGYTVFDLHMAYSVTGLIPAWEGGDVRVFMNVYNVFDEIYVQDAVDNSSFNSFDNDHDADDAEVFLGIPRNLNIGVELTF